MSRLPLAGCTFGWLHRAPLADALRELSAHGIRQIELTTAPPHLFSRHFGRYGLQAGVFTRDIDVAFDAARRLRVGGVMINDTSSYHADAMPYGGVKESGYGLEGPRYAVQDMTDPRIIVLNLGASG